MAKNYISQFLDPDLAQGWFDLVNEAFDADDLETLRGLRFRKDHPDIEAAPNVGIIFWGYLKAALDTLQDGTKRKYKAAEAAFWGETDIDTIWPLSPRVYGHMNYWNRHLTSSPKSLKKKSHKEIVRESLESVKARAKHLA